MPPVGGPRPLSVPRMFQPGKTCTWKTLWQDHDFWCKRVLHPRNTSGRQMPDHGSSPAGCPPLDPRKGNTAKGVGAPSPAGEPGAKSGAPWGVPPHRAPPGRAGRGTGAVRSPTRRGGRPPAPPRRAPGGSGGGAGPGRTGGRSRRSRHRCGARARGSAATTMGRRARPASGRAATFSRGARRRGCRVRAPRRTFIGVVPNAHARDRETSRSRRGATPDAPRP